jgi:polyhydroxybutyrate depolymerase
MTTRSRSTLGRASFAFVAGLLIVGASATAAAVLPAGAAVRPGPVAAGPPTPSPGCSAAPEPAVTNQPVHLTVAGMDRYYLLTTPAPSTPSPTPTPTKSATAGTPVPRPLVVDIHGLAEGASVHAITTQFGALGQKDGFVAVFPNGTGNPVQWNTTDQTKSNPDLEFITALLQQVESTQCIDMSRVYASGLSDGSFMVSLLACTMSNSFAAIGAVSGLQLPKPCHTTRSVPIITFHGTADPILYFNGGVGVGLLKSLFGTSGTPSPSASTSTTTTTTQPAKLHGRGVPATVQGWAVKDGCNPKSTDTRLSSQVIRRTYVCPPKTNVLFYIIVGGGHAWPGSKFSQQISKITGLTTFQINATTTMWAFFQQFRL